MSRIIPFKLKRFTEWLRCIRAGGHRPDWLKMLRLFFGGILHLSRPRFRRRMRTCPRCPVYDPAFKRCHAVMDGKIFGCGCYCPAIALFYPPGKKCWARERNPTMGWQ